MTISVVREQAFAARQASSDIREASTFLKNMTIRRISEGLLDNAFSILTCNQVDVRNAIAAGQSESFIDRLHLTKESIEEMAWAAMSIADLADPVGQLSDFSSTASGLQIGKMRVPIGVIATVYESRPNVTVDAACLALKSGNAILLRGGSEAAETNKVLIEIIAEALDETGLSRACVQYVDDPGRTKLAELIQLGDLVDVLIPRGGRKLIEYLAKHCRIPMIKHLNGICHVYVHEDADLEMALEILVNSKCQRPSTCNSCETLLVDSSVAATLMPLIGRAFEEKRVKVHACERSLTYLANAMPANEDDWRTEWLAMEISIRIVEGLDAAITHINHYGSHHTDVIVSNSLSATQRFFEMVDSAVVLSNTSTRLADGGEFGLGAEIGTSTDKLHVRGPVGVAGLTTQKTIVRGNGQLKEDR
jgi:glutamate-5-semialdehyde dehydrogenase